MSIESGELLLKSSHGGDGAAWQLEECQNCHALSSIHRDVEVGTRELIQDKGYPSCTGCHGSNGTQAPRRCTLCHNPQDLADAPFLDGIHSHNFTSQGLTGLDDEQCLVCHKASDMNGEFSFNRDLTRLPNAQGLFQPYTSSSEFCLRCHNRDHQIDGFTIEAEFHDPLIAMEDYFLLADKHGEIDGVGNRTYAGLRDNYSYQSRVECTDCHAMHGTENQGLIVDRSNKGLSRLEQARREMAYPIESGNGEHAQLCVMCHQMQTILDDGASNTGNGLSGVHQATGDCAECHSHGEAVQAGL